MVNSQSVLPLRVISGSMIMELQESFLMSMLHITTQGQAYVSGLLPETMLMSKGCAEQALSLTRCGTQQSKTHFSAFGRMGPDTYLSNIELALGLEALES